MRSNTLLFAIFSAALFGAATPASKWLLLDLTPIQLAGLLYLGAAIAVMPASFRKGSSSLPSINDRPNQLRLVGAILFGGIFGPVLLMLGLSLAQAGAVSLWLNLELAATAIIGVLFFRDHLSMSAWVGVVIAVVAAALLSLSQTGSEWIAGLLVLLACLMWGIDNHLTATIDGITPSQSTFWKGLVAGIVNLSIGISLDPITLDLTTIFSALLVGALSYGLSIVLYIKASQDMGATRAQVVFSSAPFFGLILSAIFLNELISTVHIAAGGLFIVAIAFLMRDNHAHHHVHNTSRHKHSHRHDDGHHNHTHEGLSPSVKHSHFHDHESMDHAHPHWPDLHHRHDHDPH
jgi:drug/metabolite transporter (DMT)-like permease